MPNSILPQDQNGRELFNAISSFFCTFNIGNLLRKCNAQKEKGFPVIDIFKYKLCNVFSDWTDGNTFLPVNSSLLASSKESNLIGPIGDFTAAPSLQSAESLHR